MVLLSISILFIISFDEQIFSHALILIYSFFFMLCAFSLLFLYLWEYIYFLIKLLVLLCFSIWSAKISFLSMEWYCGLILYTHLHTYIFSCWIFLFFQKVIWLWWYIKYLCTWVCFCILKYCFVSLLIPLSILYWIKYYGL